MQDARDAWEQAAAHADPTSDLDLILQINEALAGVGGSSISSISTAAAPAATPALKAVPHVSDQHATAAPQPQKTAEAGIAAAHANGVISAGQTSMQPASSTAAGKQSSSAAAAADVSGKGGKAAPATKAFKGFLKPVPGGSKPSSTDASATGSASSSSASAAAAAAGSGGKGSSGSSSGGDAALEIDCAAEQQKQQRAVPASFGEQVAQQQQSSVMLTIAITQVSESCGEGGGMGTGWVRAGRGHHEQQQHRLGPKSLPAAGVRCAVRESMCLLACTPVLCGCPPTPPTPMFAASNCSPASLLGVLPPVVVLHLVWCG